MELSPTQQSIVNHQEGALLVVAGPGSGKTRVLTERIHRLIEDGDGNFHVMALTFTNKAANEMIERLEVIPNIHQRAFIGTLHSFCSEVLTNRGKSVGIDGAPNLFEKFLDRKQVLREAVMSDPLLAHELMQRGDSKQQDRAVGDWLAAISEAKRRLLVSEAVDDELLRRVYNAYDNGLRHSGALDYDDLLLLTYRLFMERPKIANFYRRLYRYICVDEAQDLNEAQYRLLQALCGDDFRNVMLVGDPDQAIFQWNGAHPKYLDLFERDFGASKYALNDNFRSSKKVIELARKLVPGYEGSIEHPVQGGVGLLIAENEEDEASQVLDYLNQLLNLGHQDIEGSVSLERCAVLARNRYVLAKLEALLLERDIPYYKQISTQHESESDLLKDFELCLRLLSNPRDRLHLNGLLGRWGIPPSLFEGSTVGDCSELITRIKAYVSSPEQNAILDAIRAVGVSSDRFDFIGGLKSLEGFVEKLGEDEKDLPMRDIQQWHSQWDTYLRGHAGGQPSVRGFLAQVALGGTQKPRQDGLALLTVHSAKGLEFDVVVVMGMMQGVFPDYRAVGPSLEEERRNLFVAVTRSRRLLCFSYAKQRVMPWGDSKWQQPSIFLSEMGM